jgi:predicted aspartyl protease
MLRRLLPPTTGLGTALLAVCLNIMLTACTTPSPRRDAEPVPIAWQATDFRVITRMVDGVERALYTFMLVLEETQGRGIILTHLDSTTYHPGFAMLPASERTAIRWELRPYGELRQFFYSSPCCFEARFGIPGRLAPAWHILLTGTNDHGQPVRLVIDLSLPPQPSVLAQRQAAAPPRAALATTAPVPTVVGSAVPFATMRHTVLVHAMLNHQEPVTLLLDTGATRTLLTPDIARRLGLSPESDTPRSSMVTLGSQEGELPLIRLASLAVGDAAVEDLQVGVCTALPHAPFIDGLLGGDFLQHFTLRLNYARSRLQLIPQDTSDTSPSATSPPVAVLSTMPTEVIDNHMLVQAMLNHTEPVTLLLDTGTTYTMLTPETARRAGLQPTRHKPMGLLKVVGGQQVRFPLVPIAALAMGDAVVKNLQVGILAAFPATRPIDGLLGGDFLEHFTLTLDYRAKRLQLTPALSGRRED